VSSMKPAFALPLDASSAAPISAQRAFIRGLSIGT
jgi:hypothetical protein